MAGAAPIGAVCDGIYVEGTCNGWMEIDEAKALVQSLKDAIKAVGG